MSQKTIFISADHGLAIIYFMQSELLSTLLQAGLRLVLLTDDALKEQIEERFSQPGLFVEGLRLEQVNDYAARVDRERRVVVKFSAASRQLQSGRAVCSFGLGKAALHA